QVERARLARIDLAHRVAVGERFESIGRSIDDNDGEVGFVVASASRQEDGRHQRRADTDRSNQSHGCPNPRPAEQRQCQTSTVCFGAFYRKPGSDGAPSFVARTMCRLERTAAQTTKATKRCQTTKVAK